MAAALGGMPGSKPLAKLPEEGKRENKSVLESAKETATWVWTKAGELAGPASGFATSAVWFTFCAATLLAVPVLIEMQREAMLVVEKEQQSQQVEELQRQLASIRNNQSITSTIGALVGAASGGSDAPAQGGDGASA